MTGKEGKGGKAGDNRKLQSKGATLYLADSSVVGSGPTGPSVTLNLALGFKPKAAGRTYAVEVLAADDTGQAHGFELAGSLTVDKSRRGA